MPKERNFLSPRTLFGNGSVSQIGTELNKLGVENVTIITTEAFVKNGATKKIENLLEVKNLKSSVFADVEPEPSVTTAERALDFLKSKNSDSVIGLGGGSAMDVAKAVSVGATNNGIRNAVGINKVQNFGIPHVLIPTTAGTGSEATNVAVLTDQSNKKVVIYSNNLFPTIAIVDPKLTMTAPRDVTAHTGMDALTHAIEAYLSVNSSHMSDATATKALELTSNNLVLAYNEPSNAVARYNMSLAALLGGMSITNAGVEMDGCPIAGAGIAHAVGLATGTIYKLPHGLSVGMVLPSAMEFLKEQQNERLANIAEAMGEEKDAGKAIKKIESMMASIGIQRKLSDYGKDGKANLSELVDQSMSAKRLLLNLPKEITREQMQSIIESIF